MDPDITIKIFTLLLLLYATSLHELAHAWTSTLLGDPTPGKHGRLTWNPLDNLQPLMTAIVLPCIFYLSGMGMIMLATTPIDPSRFRRPLRDHALVAGAGPLVNFLFAGVLIGLIWIPGVAYHSDALELTYNGKVLFHAAFLCMVFGVFNLFPLPPLDGYWIVRGLLPTPLRMKTDSFARSGTLPFIVVFIGGSILLSMIYRPLLNLYIELLPLEFLVSLSR